MQQCKSKISDRDMKSLQCELEFGHKGIHNAEGITWSWNRSAKEFYSHEGYLDNFKGGDNC